MPENDLYRIAQEYADRFNRSDPAIIDQLMSEACIEPRWDDRTNILTLVANSIDERGLVLASEPGGEDYVVVRFTEEWVVDPTPVDWELLEEALAEPPWLRFQSAAQARARRDSAEDDKF